MAKQLLGNVQANNLSKVAFFIKTNMGKSTFLQGKNSVLISEKPQFWQRYFVLACALTL